MRATDTPDGDRRPDLQHLSFQFRDIPRRHPVDPRRPVERRARPWHVQHQVMARIILPPAVMRVLPSLASAQVSLVKDTSPVAIISVPELSYVSLKLRGGILPHPRSPHRRHRHLLAARLSQANSSTGFIDAGRLRNDNSPDRAGCRIPIGIGLRPRLQTRTGNAAGPLSKVRDRKIERTGRLKGDLGTRRGLRPRFVNS